MKIVINALQYKEKNSGIGVMLRELMGPLTGLTPHRCQVILPADGPEFPAAPGTEQIRCPWRHGQGLRRIWFQSFRMGRRYCRDALLLTTDSKVPFFLPRSCRVVPLVTDLAVYRMSQVYQPSRVLLWRLQYAWLRHRADCFLAVSEFTRQDMVELLHIPPERIRVVPCAASCQMRRVEDRDSLDRMRSTCGLPPSYVLFVGNNNPRKNLARLIRAFDRARRQGHLEQELVIAGEQGWKFDRDAVLQGVENPEAVHFIGFVPDEAMPALYSGADLFAFPTLYEGFGIPVIEAQLCGTPVLTSQVSALPEVAGDGAVYVDPRSEEDICRGILEVLRDPERRAKLVRAGLKNGARFSWERSAERLNHILEEYLARDGARGEGRL